MLKDFATLTPQDQRRRMQTLAQSALAHYDVIVQRCTRVGDSTNLIYRIDSEDGHHFALRLAAPGWRSLSDLQAEALWLEALTRDTDICVPHMVRAKNGEAVVTAQVDGVPEPRYATLMSWLPGEVLDKELLTKANLVKMGNLFGRMHIHGAAWQPPVEFAARRFDRMFARGEPDVLFDAAQQDAFTPHSLAILQQVREKVDAAYASIDPADLRVIHCDLWHENIKVYKGQLCPFDFEDTIWGYRLHDIAMAMLDLLEVVGNERYETLLAAFQRGYIQHLAWPEGDLTTLQMGRYLWKLNYVARRERVYLAKFVEYCAGLFERALVHGTLVFPAKA